MKLRTTEVDGVPVYWVPGDGPLRASLWFRAGMVDETLPTRGSLHLLEHLALHGQDSIRTPVNGHVSMLHTSFDVEGEPEEVVAFLRRTCRWLSGPEFSQLEHERRVLRAEGSRRNPGEIGHHLLWRYGARGPGLAGHEEYGLLTADIFRLHDLARSVYTRGNAALALSGPPPAGLELPLPSGSRMLTPPALPCDQPLPAGFAGRQDGIALSGTVVRSSASTALQRALERDLQKGLRHGSGVGYSAWSSYELVDAGRAMVTVGMDLVPEALPTVVAETTAVLRRLRDRGPDPDDLRDDLELRIRRLNAQPADQWLPFMAARDALLGGPMTSSVEELAAEIDAITVADVRQAALSLWKDLLVSVDPDGSGDPQLTWLSEVPVPAGEPTGQRFRSADWPVATDALYVSETGVRVQGEHGRSAAAYDELAGMLAFPDGGRQLIRVDGFQLNVEPTRWRNGREAVRLIDNAVPGRLRVPLADRPAAHVPRSSVRRIDRVRTWLNMPKVWVPFLIVCIGVLALFTSRDELEGVIGRIVLVGLGIGVITYFNQRRKGGTD